VIIINFYTNYLYTVVVDSVGMGYVSAEGKTLRLIGNFPVQPGDVVFTDGRIAYGHAPTKPQTLNAESVKGIPFICNSSSYNSAVNLSGKKIAKITKKSYPTYVSDLVTNWSWTEPSAFYCYSRNTANPGAQRMDANDTGLYLDMHVTKNAVYTAEFSNNLLSWEGQPSKPVQTNRIDPNFHAANFYFTESGDYSPSNGHLDFNWFLPDYPTTGDGGRVYQNVPIKIRRNGHQIGLIDLSNYTWAVDKLKELYCTYDTLDTAIEKRYHWEGFCPAETEMYYDQVDIFVSHTVTQCLSFHFTDDAGNWEAVIFNLCEGYCSPHTIDQEYNEETEEYEDVHSFYNFPAPVIYYINKVTSSGRVTELQHHIIIKQWEKNNVTNKEWINAASVPIETCNDKSTRGFWLNFANGCAYFTDLRTISAMKYNGVNVPLDTRLRNIRTCNYLIIPNYHLENKDMGAINSYLSVNLANGDSEYELYNPTHGGGFVSGNSMFQYGLRLDLSQAYPFVYLSSDGLAWLGHAFAKIQANKMFCGIQFVQFWSYSDNRLILETGPYLFSQNAEILRDIKKLRRPKTINDLIASRRIHNNNEDSS
jgi:hypothetical protein